ncbi:hypothetical protein C0Z18_00795 [Trinickia dabaoshanensis]|uniref:Uncharacterized protein n=1 Tax=Trinickia dabaoshanensis TaxID=564714 RepID=A0A2N7W2X3_9BURK|nr:hypothetical protein C0Z18_00795 [Trinickia dabaoshanensis]
MRVEQKRGRPSPRASIATDATAPPRRTRGEPPPRCFWCRETHARPRPGTRAASKWQSYHRVPAAPAPALARHAIMTPFSRAGTACENHTQDKPSQTCPPSPP